ncbi:MAG TPA: cellulase family glycosylhydrolase [Candidatus Saccharimonadales bacterium]|nr:cellulase family glycosylhydrolase [Candidatus Saccharimonadales bacterium]
MKKLFFVLFIFILFVGALIFYKNHTFFSLNSVHKSAIQQNMYYGVNVDMSQLIPGSKNYVTNSEGQDFIDIASHLGIRMFRITGVGQTYDMNGGTLIYTKEQWDTVLNKMAAHGIKAVILIEANSNDPQLTSSILTDRYLELVKQMVIDPDLGSHTNVYAIDLKNEPILTSENLTKLQQARQIIKTKYPQLPVTVGGWKVDLGHTDANGNEALRWNDPRDVSLLSNIVDFYAVHLYGFDQPVNGIYPDAFTYTQNFFKQNQKYLKNKPVLVEEFGSADGDAITDQNTLGSKELQANTYDGFYNALNEVQKIHIIGSAAYVLYPRGLPFPDGWDILANNANTLYPAAYVLQKYATGKSDIQLHLPYQAVPKDIVITNDSDGKAISVSKNDIVALQIHLPSSNTYTVTMSDSSMLTNTEPLNYDSNYGTYDAVYHMAKSGLITLRVVDSSRKVFTVTLRIS